ncbi:2-dehydro-3-deoxygalactonokinase [Microbulbifer sp. 2205BS26-8]|uniref:2-dehydro-3-deoxygalactonokinase n=1 Tax=Microbulbifer sp. 2205BS26-8 TaxID=3064386 RepID=UPI00273FD24C|nr:2-dehydro-3-deoxygalactonokinase [Microbulbifer sp. 2205BS26-8]MDP5210809.1 2-dehydro-3-deoxygalactonokinase [Microbulbifer sp. 2205BS26-8]
MLVLLKGCLITAIFSAYLKNSISEVDMSGQYFIAGDWGTSNLRLYLLDESGSVVDERSGKGIGQLQPGKVESELFSLIEPWAEMHDGVEIVLCGMVGSTLGLKEASYVECPADKSDISRQALRFQLRGHGITIVPGITSTSPYGYPDVMRGEETQILGAIVTDDTFAQGTFLFCLPGTHVKWVLYVNGKITSILSAISGELFSVLSTHSVLFADATEYKDISASGFMRGVEQTLQSGACNLIHTLFSVRSSQLRGDITPEEAKSYMSGLIISADVVGAAESFRSKSGEVPPIVLIGDDRLSSLYGQIFDKLGLQFSALNGNAMSISGLYQLLQLSH